MKYLLEGPQADVVLQENRYRIAMGMVKITPVADEVVEQPEEPKAQEEPVAPEEPEVPEEPNEPEEPEVPETDSKEPAAESDTKDAPDAEDDKEVTADADTKDVEVADEKASAVSKAKKSSGSTKK